MQSLLPALAMPTSSTGSGPEHRALLAIHSMRVAPAIAPVQPVSPELLAVRMVCAMKGPVCTALQATAGINAVRQQDAPAVRGTPTGRTACRVRVGQAILARAMGLAWKGSVAPAAACVRTVTKGQAATSLVLARLVYRATTVVFVRMKGLVVV